MNLFNIVQWKIALKKTINNLYLCITTINHLLKHETLFKKYIDVMKINKLLGLNCFI